MAGTDRHRTQPSTRAHSIAQGLRTTARRGFVVHSLTRFVAQDAPLYDRQDFLDFYEAIEWKRLSSHVFDHFAVCGPPPLVIGPPTVQLPRAYSDVPHYSCCTCATALRVLLVRPHTELRCPARAMRALACPFHCLPSAPCLIRSGIIL